MKKAAVKKPGQRAQEKLSISKSGLAASRALTDAYPRDATRILQLMRPAATSASLKRKLARVELALGTLKKEAQQ